MPIESLPVGQCAGAVLRENIYAERDHPPFDRVAMDGVALCSAAAASGRRRFRIQATQAAGDPALSLGSIENCIEVMTGVVLPQGCDTVVPVERLEQRRRVCPDLKRGWAQRFGPTCIGAPAIGTQGALLLATGNLLHAPEIAVAASAAMARRARQQSAGHRGHLHGQ